MYWRIEKKTDYVNLKSVCMRHLLSKGHNERFINSYTKKTCEIISNIAKPMGQVRHESIQDLENTYADIVSPQK